MGYMIIGAGLFLAGAFFGIVFESYGEIWQEAQPFLKPAAANSKNALEQCFKKAFEE